MSAADRALLAVLVLVSVLLAVVELLYVPLRLDGALLPLVADLPVPVSAVLALVSMPWLTRSATELSDRAVVGAAPLFAWLATLLVFGVFGPGGDLVLIADWRTLLLLACGAFPAALVLGGRVGGHTDHRG